MWEQNLNYRVEKVLKKEKSMIVRPPGSLTILGTESHVVCKIKQYRDDSIKYICESERSYKQEPRFFVMRTLDHCVDQLHILCGGKSGNDPLAFFDQVLKDKTDDLMFEPIYDKNTGEPFNVAFRRIQINKLYNDGTKLKDFLNAVKNELKESLSFTLFRQTMFDVKLKINEAEILCTETAENQNKMKDLKYALATQSRDARLAIQKVNKSYKISCETIEEIHFKTIIELRYAKAYEKSRFEQNKIKCEREIRALQKTIFKYRHQIEAENRAHVEILRYINNNQKDLKENIKIWVHKYNMDMEQSHFLILQIKDRFDEIKIYHEELKILYADHKRSIEDFKKYKENKLKLEEAKQRLINAATKIQAWWRGNMYRHQLGPYNPNKGKKGKGKKKKKKKQ